MARYDVRYYTFVFPYPTLAAADFEVLYAADGGQMGTRYHFVVTGCIAGASQEDFAAKVALMKCRLQTPRQGFVVRWSPDDSGDVWNTLYDLDGAGDDIDWGPRPGGLRMTTFSGGRSGFYSWEMTATVQNCAGVACAPAGRPTEVVSLVRRFEHKYDACGFCTRTVSGSLVVTSTSVQAGKSADAFRGFTVPPLAANFKREDQHFSQSEDGRTLTFSYTDQEVMNTLPAGVSFGEANFSSRVNSGGDRRLGITYCLSGHFEGPASTGKGLLLQRLVDLIAAKFPVNGPGALIFENRDITETVYGRNRLEFSISAWGAFGTTDDGNPDYSGGLSTIGVTPPDSDGKAQTIGAYGGDGKTNSGVSADALAPFNTCNPNYGNVGGGGSGGGSSSVNYPLTPGDPGSRSQQQLIPGGDPTGGVSASQINTPFIAVHDVVSYNLDNKIRYFAPKMKGQDPVIQQTAMPELTIIQAGYRIQVAKNVTDIQPPPKPVLGANGVLMLADVDAPTGDPIAGGEWTAWKTRYRYLIKYKLALKQADLSDVGIVYPEDPSRNPTPDADRTVKGLPDLVLLPQ